MFINVFRDKCSSDRSEKCFIHTYMLKKSVRCGAYSVDLACAAAQMKALRESFGLPAEKRIMYLRLTFVKYECKGFTEDFAEMLAQKVCMNCFSEYQVVYGVHHYNERWHLHIVLNPVNMHTGRIFEMDSYDKKRVADVMMGYSGAEMVCVCESN